MIYHKFNETFKKYLEYIILLKVVYIILLKVVYIILLKVVYKICTLIIHFHSITSYERIY